MGLSNDPEKRERQLAGLRKGQEALARKLGYAPPAAKAEPAEAAPPAKARAKASPGKKKPPAKARAKASPGSRADVVDYDQEHRARTPKAPKPKPRSGGDRRPARGGGFLDGFFGG